MKKIFTFLLALSLTSVLFAQTDTTDEKTKDGWNFGLLPTISYNTDLGLQYGLLVDLYNYGDGALYPNYYQKFYVEVSRYTKGGGNNRLFFDSKHLIPNIRTTFDIAYYTDQAIDFYGFNGYQSKVNFDWIDTDSPEYKSRMYYKHARQYFQVKADFQGNIGIKNLNWVAGAHFVKVGIQAVDVDGINTKSDSTSLLTNESLFNNFVNWGILDADEADGGINTFLKLGLVYDTRDNEPCPTKGLWSEVVVTLGPKWLGNPEYSYGKIAATHRQYFTIVEDRLSFAYRVSGQATLFGEVPFYMEPIMLYSFFPSTSAGEGLGGAKNVRGVIRNRIVGDAFAYANLEFRWKIAYFKFIKQNWYVAANPFFDLGTTLVDFDVDKTGIDPLVDQSDFFDQDNDGIHMAYGCGIHLAMNENFVIAADVGFPIDKRDHNKYGLYIGMNWLF